MKTIQLLIDIPDPDRYIITDLKYETQKFWWLKKNEYIPRILHRNDGPAYINFDGVEVFYLNGLEVDRRYPSTALLLP